MSRLAVVSNRAPGLDSSKDSGGLVVALRDALSKRGGLWIGGSGEPAKDPAEHLRHFRRRGFNVALFDLTQQEIDDYYLGFSNSVLWPAFHGRTDLIRYTRDYWQAYVDVNRRLARMICETVEPDDPVWVHDYQLIPIASEMRKLGATNRIGFFLHIPIPPHEIFRAIPPWLDLAGNLADYDAIGLQTKRDVAHLIDIFRNGLAGEIRSNGNIGIGGREVVVRSFPISIDVAGFRDAASKAVRKLDQPSLDQLIGVDRLDYSKGLIQRLEGYRIFLQEHPERKGHVSLLQIAPPTREDVEAYKRIRAELELLAGEINGEFATIDWSPIRYIHRSIKRNVLAGLYRQSRAGLVTPVFDGMNLVAKEYVAAQDEADPGVLILSQFAGAAEEMQEALIINPHDTPAIARAIEQALQMPLGERRRRHALLYERLLKNDVANWSENFLRHLVGQTSPVPSIRLTA